eukprot:GHVH01008042.1.p1 GENE.GHVH01008042.1~~GHVH01008042.1.p1  ORF type:complete len:149 (+),score=9.68 GHVH01008042.1:553-999(+)
MFQHGINLVEETSSLLMDSTFYCYASITFVTYLLYVILLTTVSPLTNMITYQIKGIITDTVDMFRIDAACLTFLAVLVPGSVSPNTIDKITSIRECTPLSLGSFILSIVSSVFYSIEKYLNFQKGQKNEGHKNTMVATREVSHNKELE